jgi:kynurenine 3-monooxygenase
MIAASPRASEVTEGGSLGITVAGAGPAGLIVAMYLARRFGPIAVLEQHNDPRRNTAKRGRSLMVVLSVRGWRVLRELGLEQRVKAICMPLRGRRAHLPDGSEHFTPYSRDGEPIWAVEREKLLHVLLSAAQATPGVHIYFQHRICDIDLDGPRICISSSSRNRWLECERLIGCDGAHSAVRTALVALGAQEYVDRLELGYQEINFPHRSLDPGEMHYWPVGDGLFGAFPRVSSGLFAGSVFLRLEGPPPSYASVATATEMADRFAAIFPDLAKTIPDLPEQLANKPVATIPLVRCDRWVWRDRVALVGDSCHAMAPFMGHGMNCGFEDARTLVNCLDTAPDWDTALAAYEDARKQNADAIADISYEHYNTMSHAPGKKNLAADVSKRLTDILPDKFVPLYERCSFTEESYASARENDRLLRELSQDLLRKFGFRLPNIPDRQLRQYALAWHPE